MNRRHFTNFLRLLAAATIAALLSHIVAQLTGTPLTLPKGPTP